MLLRHFPDEQTFRRLAKTHNVLPVCAEILADTETPVSLLYKLYRRQGPTFLLESVAGGERWGRYSFLGTHAYADIQVFADAVRVTTATGHRSIPHGGAPLHVLKKLMKTFRAPHMAELPRFWGGLVGYLTYETVAFFEDIPTRWPEAKPLAHFIIPEELLIFDNIRNTLTLVVLVFTDPERAPGRLFLAARKRIAARLREIRRPPHPPAAHTDQSALRLTASIPPAVYRNNVREVQKHILAGDIIQAVIAQPFSCREPADLCALYRAQRYINPSPYLFFLNLGRLALIGSSPETMVRLENGVATLRPIAGTRPRGRNEAEDRRLADELLRDEKERAEHLMLVDLGRNDLGRVAASGTVQVTDLMSVERYSHVMHLVSNICCDLRADCDAWELLRATFPAGTLSGAPKIRAMQIIAELEQIPRGAYGGAVGYISFQGNMDLAITIRTAAVENGRLTVMTGAGIVADSRAEGELAETINKAKAMQKALHLLAIQTGEDFDHREDDLKALRKTEEVAP